MVDWSDASTGLLLFPPLEEIALYRHLGVIVVVSILALHSSSLLLKRGSLDMITPMRVMITIQWR
jgi:hypothetical protein